LIHSILWFCPLSQQRGELDAWKGNQSAMGKGNQSATWKGNQSAEGRGNQSAAGRGNQLAAGKRGVKHMRTEA